MSIKSTIGPVSSNTKAYPKLMKFKNTGEIWLLSAPHVGIRVSSGAYGAPIGLYSGTVQSENSMLWEDYSGPVTLQND